jgi:hypothetical protein
MAARAAVREVDGRKREAHRLVSKRLVNVEERVMISISRRFVSVPLTADRDFLARRRRPKEDFPLPLPRSRRNRTPSRVCNDG